MTFSHITFSKELQLINTINDEVLMIFKIPLFVIISGILFSDRLDFWSFFKHKLDSLIKPMFVILVFSFISFLFYRFNFSTSGIIQSVRDTYLTFFPLWFLPSLFLSLLIFRIIVLIYKQKSILFGSIFTLFVGLVLYFFVLFQVDFKLVKLNTLFYFTLFLGLGFAINKLKLYTQIFSYKAFILSFVTFGLTMYFKNNLNIKINFFENIYGNLFFTTIAAFTGSIFILNLSKHVFSKSITKTFFIFCSKASLFILAFHFLIYKHLVLPYLSSVLDNDIVIDILSFILMIACCLLFYKGVYNSRFLKHFLLPSPLISMSK